MGLDMYLNRMPRYKDATAQDVSVIQNYLDWKAAKVQGSKYANCTLEKWCGIKWRDIPNKEYRDFYSKFYTIKYWDWDTEHKYPNSMIMEQVGYWRKANHIHNWFVENIQDDEDDCNYHREVTKKDLEDLLDVCETVVANSKLINGKIINGYSYDGNFNKVCHYEDGQIIEDSTIAEKLLPTQSGFFFGGTEYDEWYLNDVKDTIDIIKKVLETTDFETQMIYYCSSW